MTKTDLVERVHDKVGFSKKDSADLVELTLEIVKETLERGETVKIPGFGQFVVRQKRARCGRNPQTGEKIEITPRRVMTFKPSQALRQAIIAGV